MQDLMTRKLQLKM